MRKVALVSLVLMVVAVLGVATASRIQRKPPSAPPFPCVVTAKTGWLTAVTSQALLRLEWDESSGRVGVAALHGALSWTDRPAPEVRALALRVLEPISSRVDSDTRDEVSLFAGCDGTGAQWKGRSDKPPPSYGRCLFPNYETRFECLRRVRGLRGALVDEAPGAVSDRITTAVIAGGIALDPPLPYGYDRPEPGLIDELRDRLQRKHEPEFIDFQF